MTQTTTWTTWTTYRVPESLTLDTEESVVGTEWHQEAIGALADMLRAVADRRGAAWGVCAQVALVGLRYSNGLPYDPRPDVMILARPLPGGEVSSIPVTASGAPLFVAEVASVSTGGNDIGEKRRAYEAIGVSEYVVFDAVGNVLPVPLRAWRLRDGVYVPWAADADGWWHSVSLGIAFRATQPFLSVQDRDGTAILPSREVRRRLDAVEQERDRLARRLAATEQAQAEETRRRVDLEEQLRRLRVDRDRQDNP